MFYQICPTNFVPGWAQVDGHISSSPAVPHLAPQGIPSWISRGRICRTNAAVGSLCRSQFGSCWGLWIESEREWLTITSPSENTARSAGRTTEKITLVSAYAKLVFYLEITGEQCEEGCSHTPGPFLALNSQQEPMLRSCTVLTHQLTGTGDAGHTEGPDTA